MSKSSAIVLEIGSIKFRCDGSSKWAERQFDKLLDYLSRRPSGETFSQQLADATLTTITAKGDTTAPEMQRAAPVWVASQAPAKRGQVELELRAVHHETFSPEWAAQRLLGLTKYKRRTFQAIKYHLGGYDDDELRKLLVRAGAVRFQEDVETWGLITRNEKELDEDRFTRDF